MPSSRTAIIAVAFVCQGIAIGTTIGAFTLFVEPVSSSFSASRMQVSFGISFITMMLAVGGMTIGSTLDRGHVRRVMLTGAVLLASALLLGSRTSQLWQLGVLTILAGFAIPMLGPLTGSALVGKVFVRGRGRALGISNIGTPTGGLVFALIAGFGIDAVGWRSTLMLFSGIVLGVIIPLVVAFVPANLDSIADAASDHDAPGALPSAPAPAPASASGDWSPARLLRSRDFLAAAVTLGIIMGTSSGWSPHLAPYMSDLGSGTVVQSAVVATSMGTGILGTLLFGMLVDHIPARRLMLLTPPVLAAGFATLLYAPPLPVVFLAIVVLGLFTSGFLPIFTTYLVERFGVGSLGRAMGLGNVFILPFGFSVPPIAGALRDQTGNYDLVLGALVAVFLVHGAISLFLIPGEPGVRRELPAA